MYAVVSFVGTITASGGIAGQKATLNPSLAPGRPYLDLAYQLLSVGFGVVPALLAVHLLRRDPGRPGLLLGVGRRRWAADVTVGAGLAALIGLPGLGLYVLSRTLGINAEVVPAALPPQWWAVPVLALAAVQNAVLEEVVAVGYLQTRLRQLRWRWSATILASAGLRATYHLYQGVGAFVGNLAMGLIFSAFFVRYRRVGPLIVAHTILDLASFIGYALLRDRLPFR
jgi:membrane protease YdiL (CAAX protease family)